MNFSQITAVDILIAIILSSAKRMSTPITVIIISTIMIAIMRKRMRSKISSSLKRYVL